MFEVEGTPLFTLFSFPPPLNFFHYILTSLPLFLSYYIFSLKVTCCATTASGAVWLGFENGFIGLQKTSVNCSVPATSSGPSRDSLTSSSPTIPLFHRPLSFAHIPSKEMTEQDVETGLLLCSFYDKHPGKRKRKEKGGTEEEKNHLF